MKKFARWLSSKCIKDYQDTNNLKVKARYGALEGWISITGNLALFIIKIILGISVNSISLIADSIHTLSDSATSSVVIIGFKMAKKPSDQKHPFGHGRLEPVTTLIISMLLFVAGFEILKGSIGSIIKPQTSIVPWPAIFIITGSIIIKELMARFAFELGDMINSTILKADAYHHRTDAFSTLLVIVALVSAHYRYNYVDGIMGVLVSFIIVYTAYSIAKTAIDPLLGEAPSKEQIREIESLATEFEIVSGVHDIIFHKYGAASIISLHIEVPEKESVFKLHAISEEVEEKIAQKLNAMVVVHIDPINKDHPQYKDIEKTITNIIARDPRVVSFHDMRIVGGSTDRCNVVFDIVLEKNVDELDSYEIIRKIKEYFKVSFPSMNAIIKAEPKYAYSPL